MGGLALEVIVKKFSYLVEKQNISSRKYTNYQTLILFLIVLTTCVVSDFYFKNSNLIIPFITSTLISSIITFLGIPKLKKFKINQIIRKEGPKKHLIKQGTPTMGGIFFIPIGIIISNILYITKDDYKNILILSFVIISFMFIGFIDDFLSLKKQLNTGLKSKQKIILQSFISVIFIIICSGNNLLSYNIQIAGTDMYIGNLIYPLGVFVLLAESNSTNLTDGLDGLLSGCSVLIFTGLSIIILLDNSNSNTTLAPLCIVMAGACMGFLFLNKYPAKLFMGDSGSLAIGASLGSIALISNNLWSLLIMGGVLAAESISVIIQVSVYKISKRIKGKGSKFFLMTPLHHHFELQGNNETLIVSCFWLVTLLLVMTNLFFLRS